MEAEVQLTIDQYDRDMAKSREEGKKAGIKEVVEWVNKIDIVDECCITEWQAKVKEWLGE